MKRSFTIFLCLLMLVSLLPVSAFAAEETALTAAAHPAETVEYDSPSYQMTAALLSEDEGTAETGDEGEFTYVPMTSSQSLVDLIKDCEGFTKEPYWDHGQWTVGYGTACGYADDKSDIPKEILDGVTEEEAEAMLMEYLAGSAEKEVNAFYKGIGRQPTQQQFDAMVDFTYALGGSWMYEESRVAAYLKNPTTELDLMRALGAWCRVSGSVNSATCNRRIREALIYCYGIYLLPAGSIESDLDVVYDGELPIFSYVIYEGNGTTLINTRTDDVNYYFKGDKYDSLLRPVREGYTFAGWQRKDGTTLLDGHTVGDNIRVTARWSQLPFTDVNSDSWYAPGVAYCFEEGIMNGTQETLFEPYTEASRAMIVTVLYRMAGSPKVEGVSGLWDIDGNSRYYTDAVIWAVQNGVVLGYADGSFMPQQSVSRAEMVTFLYRYAKNILGYDVTAGDLVELYEDKELAYGYAYEPFCWALSRGLINGTSVEPNLLSPRDLAQRGQLAKVLMGLANLENIPQASTEDPEPQE